MNVDIHVQSSSTTSLLHPVGGSVLRRPRTGEPFASRSHAIHGPAATTATTQAEAETDDAGNLFFGVTHAQHGGCVDPAWIDGRKRAGQRRDGGADPRVTGTVSWADPARSAGMRASSARAPLDRVRRDGNGTNVVDQARRDRAVHVVVRSDCPSFATRSGDTARHRLHVPNAWETPPAWRDGHYEFLWTPVPPTGRTGCAAHVVGAPADEEQTVTVNAQKTHRW